MSRILFLCLAMSCGLGLHGQNSAAGPRRSLPPMPAVSTNSPTQTFRRLLAMNATQREEFLATRTEPQRRSIEEKIGEFLALAPDVREGRLQALELRWYLLPLLRQPATNRTEHLRVMPLAYRQLVQQRLLIWDILPPPLQKDVLENEMAARLFTQVETSGGTAADLFRGVSPEQRPVMEKQLEQFQQLPAERQQHIRNNFNEFFGLTLKDQQKLLASARSAAADDPQLQRTIALFQDLSPEQRERVLDGFIKFNRLAPEERPAFMRSAERWQALSEKDRELWRRLVERIRAARIMPPPLPPRFGGTPGSSPALATTND